MRILHTAAAKEEYGGQEIRILSEMEEMRKLGCYLALAAKEDSTILHKAREKGFATYTLPFSKKTDFKTIWSLRKILKQDSFDIINGHSSIDNWCAGLASIGSKTKYICSRHVSNKPNSSRLNFIYTLADFIIVTGENIRQAMIQGNRIPSNKIQSIPTGIDMQVFDRNQYNKNAMREKYGIPQDALVIGNLGVLREFKRQDIFIETALEVCQNHHNVFFVIAGDGGMKPYLENLIKSANTEREIIRLLGYTQKPAEFLSTLDIFMLTSDSSEGVPQALMQALSMEIPSIASDIGSIADLHCIDNGKANFILTQNPTKEEFANALESLIQQPEILKPNRKFMVENFSTLVMREKILPIYQNLLHTS